MKTRMLRGLLLVALGAAMFLCSCTDYSFNLDGLDDLDFNIFPDGNPTISHDGHIDIRHSLKGIARSSDRFVAVGGHVALISSDGYSWEDSTTGDFDFNGEIVWNGRRFVALGDSGRAYVSEDGVHWEETVNRPEAQLYGVAWSGQCFVLVGSSHQKRGGLILSSFDGVVWTECVPEGADSITVISEVIWSGKGFTALAYEDAAFRRPAVMKSRYGFNWHTTAPTGLGDITLRTIVWDGKRYLGGGYVYDHPYTATTAVFASANGSDWQRITDSSDCTPILRKMAWSGTRYVAIAPMYFSWGSNSLWESTDGIKWTKCSWEGWGPQDLKWCGDRFVAVGNDLIVSSPDGLEWTQQTLP